MNQRLEELARQAGLESFYVEYSPWQVEFEKFAELIVRECADIASINQFQHDAVGNYVLKHFGVE